MLKVCNEGNPITLGDEKAGKCVVTLGGGFFYLPYSIIVWVRNERGEGPKPAPIIGMSAANGKLPCLQYTYLIIRQCIILLNFLLLFCYAEMFHRYILSTN